MPFGILAQRGPLSAWQKLRSGGQGIVSEERQEYDAAPQE